MILHETCKQVGCAHIEDLLCWRRYRLGNRSYDRFVICLGIVQHLMRRGKATWVFTQSLRHVNGVNAVPGRKKLDLKQQFLINQQTEVADGKLNDSNEPRP